LGITIEFKGSGINETAIVKSCDNLDYQVEIGKEILSVDRRYFRPTEVDLLVGDASKARKVLGWEPKYTLKDLVKEMIWSDIKLMKKI